MQFTAEHLDFGHFSGPEYDDILRAYLVGKYRNSPINVIVAAGPKALEFALHVRGELGSNVPVVFSIVDTATLARLRPSNATGHILQYTLRDQITSARALVPDLQHVALVGDPLETQSFMDEFRRELPIFSAQLDFIDLTGLSLQDVKRRVADCRRIRPSYIRQSMLMGRAYHISPAMRSWLSLRWPTVPS